MKISCIGNATPDVSQEKRFVIVGRGVTHSGIPGSATIESVIPGDGMIATHRAAGIGSFIDGEQNVDIFAGIGSEIVPFIGAGPVGGEHVCRDIMRIFDGEGSLGDMGMILEVGTHELTVPGPVIFGIGG